MTEASKPDTPTRVGLSEGLGAWQPYRKSLYRVVRVSENTFDIQPKD